MVIRIKRLFVRRVQVGSSILFAYIIIYIILTRINLFYVIEAAKTLKFIVVQ